MRKRERAHGWLKWFAPLLFALIFFAPFFRGLFFEKETTYHHYATSIVVIMLVIILVRQRFRIASMGSVLAISPYFWAILLMVLSYAIAIFVAINPRESLFTWLRYVDYFLIFALFFFVAMLWKQENLFLGKWFEEFDFVRLAMFSFGLTGGAVALAGLLTAQGFLSLAAATMGDRISSTLQYPNSLAAFLIPVFFLVLYLALNVKKANFGFIFGFLGSIIFITLIGTQSRGGLLLFLLLLFLLIAGLPEKRKAFFVCALIIAPSMLISGNALVFGKAGFPNWESLLWTLFGGISASLGVGGWNYWESKSRKGNKETADDKLQIGKNVQLRSRMALFLVALLFISIFIGIAGFGFSKGYHAIFGRIMETTLNDINIQLRLIFASDAMKMIADRPLFGWGGGGWASGYRAYQTFLYNSKEVHNHFLQVWVESGIIGFIAFTFPFLAVAVGILDIFRKSRKNPGFLNISQQMWALAVAILSLGLHSLIDFDLSLGAVSLLLWSMLGLYAFEETKLQLGFSKIFEQLRLRSKRIASSWASVLLSGGTIVLAIVLAFFSMALHTAASTDKQMREVAQTGDAFGLLKLFQTSSRLDPLKAEYLLKQAEILLAIQDHVADPKQRKQLAEEGLKLAQKTVERDSFNSSYRLLLAKAYMVNQQPEQAIIQLEMARKLQPWAVITYEQLSEHYLKIGLYYRNAGVQDKSHLAFQKVLEAVKEAGAKKGTLNPEYLHMFGSPDLIETPFLSLKAGQAHVLLGDLGQAKTYLSKVPSNSEQVGTANIWLGTAMIMAGDKAGYNLVENTLRITPKLRKEWDEIKRLNLVQ